MLNSVGFIEYSVFNELIHIILADGDNKKNHENFANSNV